MGGGGWQGREAEKRGRISEGLEFGREGENRGVIEGKGRGMRLREKVGNGQELK